MPILTPEQMQAVQEAGQGPVRLEDPETTQAYVILRAELYERMRALTEEDIDPSFFEIDDFEPAREDPR